MNFTTEQINIFQFVESGIGNGIIDAVAGAGKTTTIMECARYVRGQSQHALFCAFNKSIAKEITQKLGQRSLTNVVVKTIHALGWKMLNGNRNYGREILLEEHKYDKLIKSKEVQDTLRIFYEQILTINGLRPDLAEGDRNQAFAINNLTFQINKRLLDINQKYRATLTKETLDEFRKLVIHFGIFNQLEIKKKLFEQELDAYFNCTKLLLRAGNDLSKNTMTFDFTDMIYLPYEWKLQANVKYDFLFIDECQDLSRAQLAVVVKHGHENSRVLSVGDPQQSIYGFTGADIESFDRVSKLTQATPFPLTTCFRCPRKVIELAKTIRIDIVGVKDTDGLVSRITSDKVVELAKPGDLIISRLKAALLILVFIFIDKDRKVQIHEDDVREIINEVKNIFKQEELHLRISTISGGFQELKNSVLKRWQWIIDKESERIVDSVERMMYIKNQKSYLSQKLDFLHRKYEQWKLVCPTLSHIIERIREYVSSTTESVKLSTIHRAKGLENDRVFILNYDELPFQRLEQKEWERVQELNLKYVAITRAKETLFLVESPKIEVLSEKSLFDVLPF